MHAETRLDNQPGSANKTSGNDEFVRLNAKPNDSRLATEANRFHESRLNSVENWNSLPSRETWKPPGMLNVVQRQLANNS